MMNFILKSLVLLPILCILYNLFFIPNQMGDVKRLEYYPSNFVYSKKDSIEYNLNSYAYNVIGIDTSLNISVSIMSENIIRNKFKMSVIINSSNPEIINDSLILNSDKFRKYFNALPDIVKNVFKKTDKLIFDYSVSLGRKNDIFISSIPLPIDDSTRIVIYGSEIFK